MKHDFSWFTNVYNLYKCSISVWKKYYIYIRLSLVIILLKSSVLGGVKKSPDFIVQLIFEGEVVNFSTIIVDSAISLWDSMGFFLYF